MKANSPTALDTEYEDKYGNLNFAKCQQPNYYSFNLTNSFN